LAKAFGALGGFWQAILSLLAAIGKKAPDLLELLALSI